ncbi:SLATT domain-containing protein [Sphingomonas plantiphila]|uniref:SLATT domain-containing protein n=1 Tax=Sphingomonas plantiphila TaxID=3163295 RepID=UPI0038B4E97F
MNDRSQLERIYLTYKARVAAECRMHRLAFWSQILIAWYSIAIIIVSLADISTFYGVNDGGVATTSLSVLVLTASVFVYSQRFELRAASFRECYLKLQELYDSTEHPEIILKKYHDILIPFENHSNFDYDSVLLSAKVRGTHLIDAHGPIKFEGWALALHMGRIVLNYAIFIALASIPIILFLVTIAPES